MPRAPWSGPAGRRLPAAATSSAAWLGVVAGDVLLARFDESVRAHHAAEVDRVVGLLRQLGAHPIAGLVVGRDFDLFTFTVGEDGQPEPHLAGLARCRRGRDENLLLTLSQRDRAGGEERGRPTVRAAVGPGAATVEIEVDPHRVIASRGRVLEQGAGQRRGAGGRWNHVDDAYRVLAVAGQDELGEYGADRDPTSRLQPGRRIGLVVQRGQIVLAERRAGREDDRISDFVRVERAGIEHLDRWTMLDDRVEEAVEGRHQRIGERCSQSSDHDAGEPDDRPACQRPCGPLDKPF